MAAQNNDVENDHLSGPTLIPDIGEFYLEMQDELKAIKDKLQAIEISGSPDVGLRLGYFEKKKSTDNKSLHQIKLSGTLESGVNNPSEIQALNDRITNIEVSLAAYVNKIAGRKTESLWNDQSWKNFTSKCRRLRQEQANFQLPKRTATDSTKNSCSVILGNTSNAVLVNPGTWNGGATKEYLKMPQQIDPNTTLSFSFVGDSDYNTGLCSFDILGQSFFILHYVDWESRAFAIGFCPMDLRLTVHMFNDIIRKRWAASSDRTYEYRESLMDPLMEATVCSKNVEARAVMRPGTSKSHAVITALISTIP